MSNQFSSPPAGSPSGGLSSITLEEARIVVRESAMLSTASTYSDQRVDRAIQMALSKALRTTRAVTSKLLATVTGRTLDLLVIDPRWREEFFISAFVDDRQLRRVDYSTLANAYEHSAPGRPPEIIAFATFAEAHFWPSPTSASLTILRWHPLVEFTAGTATPEAVVLNVPDEWVREALWWGATSALVHSDPDEVMQSVAWQRFERLLNEVRGRQPQTAVHHPDPRYFI